MRSVLLRSLVLRLLGRGLPYDHQPILHVFTRHE